jgi:hypothetical protein
VTVAVKEFCCESACSDAAVAKDHEGRRGVALGSSRVGHSRALERRVERRGRPAWGRKPGSDDGAVRQLVPRALRLLVDFYTFAPMDAMARVATQARIMEMAATANKRDARAA